jgi:hypothetical protein
MCHFLPYTFIFWGRIFWQHSTEEDTTRMPFKRKNKDSGGCPAVKRARLMQLSCLSLEDAEEIV